MSKAIDELRAKSFTCEGHSADAKEITAVPLADAERIVGELKAQLEQTSSQPWLGNATTGQLLDELRARCEINGTINYRTVDPPKEQQ